MKYNNVYFIIGNAYAGKSTILKYLAHKYNAFLCEENYTDKFSYKLDSNDFPCLTYTRNLKDWGDFVRRTPEEYVKWIEGCIRENTILEQKILDDIVEKYKLIFVDTNISIDALKNISDKEHVLVMLTDPEESINRFFEREDKEKQFIYQLLMNEPNPEVAMNNFRKCLEKINSKANYDMFLNSGFNVLIKDESRSIEETALLAERLFKLI